MTSSPDGGEDIDVLEFVLLLDSPVLPSATVLQTYFQENMPGVPAIVEIANDDQRLELSFDERTVLIELFPERFSEKQLKPVCDFAWWWPEAWDAVQAHQSVLIISMERGETDIVEDMLLLTLLTAGLSALCEAKAVYLADGALIHDPDYFLERVIAARTAQPPIPFMLWVAFLLSEITEGTISLSTVGMGRLGYPELEVIDVEQEPHALLSAAQAVALHMLETDIVHDDGEWLEFESGKRVSIRHAPSVFNERESVLQIEFDSVHTE